MKHFNPLLIPAAVPWAVATSAPYLKLGCNAEKKPNDITFIGYFKANEDTRMTRDLSIQFVENPGDFCASIAIDDAPYRMVRVQFDGGFAYRKSYSVSDHEVISEADFDWREVPGSLRVGEDALDNIARTNAYWEETGLSPDPGFYEVINSPWIDDIGVNDPEIHHYLVVGQDEYFDIAARAWRWELGQAT